MSISFSQFKKTFSLFVSKEAFANTPNKLAFSAALLLIIIDISVASLVPFYSKKIVDSLSFNLLQSVSLSLVFLGIFWTLGKTVNHLQEIIFFPIINKTIRDLQFKVVKHIHQISLFDYQKLSMPEVINCVRRISLSARSFIKILFLMIIPTFFKLLVASFVVLKVGLFGIWLCPALLLSLFILYKGTLWYTKAREEAWSFTDTITTRISDSILNTKIIRLFQDYELRKVGNLLNTEANLWQKTNVRLHLIYIMIGTLLGITIAMILFYAVSRIQSRTLTIGDFVLLQGQLIAAFLPLKSFSIEFRQLAESLIDIKKIMQIFSIPVEKRISVEPNNLQSVESAFLFKEVSFSHEERKPILSKLSFEIARGSKTAIIGPSGCGKSSLLHLMASLYQPSEGEIYLFGSTLHQIPKAKLKEIIHCVPQDFRLFNLSLGDNLTYGIDTVSKKQLLQVITQLKLSETLREAPHGLDSLVGEMGIKLSGGEKQKVALARALLLKPKILLLDETTNSLNVEIEQEILQVIFETIPTVVLVSHRASSLKGLDKIYTFEKGRLVAAPAAPKRAIQFGETVANVSHG